MRRLVLALSAVALAVVVSPLAKRLSQNANTSADGQPPPGSVDDISLSHAKPSQPPPPPPVTPLTAGIDLLRIGADDSGATAPAANGSIAKLTVDPQMQRAAATLLRVHRLPRAAVVMVDIESGHVLAYASRSEAGKHDVCAEAKAPAASVFKIVTASALVDDAHLGPDTRECYWGGEHEIQASNLEDNPARDRECTTLASAMGHSTNTVFAKLALKHLKPTLLEAEASAYGFGEPIPFDVPTEASTLKVPSDDLGFARTSAGFWNSTLSPMQAVWLSTTVAHGGEAPRLSIVSQLVDKNGALVYQAPDAAVVRRATPPATAEAVTTMMEKTISEGTCRRAFHDGSGKSYLPGIVVAGKTGTLADPDTHALYTWFTGFAPSHPMPGVKQVAIAVLVVNRPQWHIKANVIA
ncbi:MAG: penicillin-binding transpeptidase domain-containing protein, partial [Polyangiaceae bacterium]